MSFATRDIIVVGASSGGFDALKTIAAGLPADLPAAVFVVWHMPADVEGVLPRVLLKAGPLNAAHARDGEAIAHGRIYVAPPDHHMLLEHGKVRVVQGPKENGFRPAVDPLFRSAAYAHGPRVIAVVLSGALDDGTAGLWLVKRRGGLAVVQDPRDAAVPSMPESALRAVAVDKVAPAAELAQVLADLSRTPVPAEEDSMARPRTHDDTLTELELLIAAGDTTLGTRLFEQAELTPYSCPECHGVLACTGWPSPRRS